MGIYDSSLDLDWKADREGESKGGLDVPLQKEEGGVAGVKSLPERCSHEWEQVEKNDMLKD